MIPAEIIVQDWFKAAHAGGLSWGILCVMCRGAYSVAVATGDAHATRVFMDAGVLAQTLAGGGWSW